MVNLTQGDLQKLDEYPMEVDSEEGESSPNTSCQNIYCWSDEKALAEIHAYVFPNHYEWILIILYLVVFVVGLAGNFLVIFAVWRNKHLQTITNMFLVNLAVADFMVILIVLPPTVVVDVSETWFLGLYMCKAVSFLQDVSIYVSVQTLAATSVERWSAICHPLTFQEKTPRRAMVIIVCIWLVSMCAAAPNMVSLTLHWEFRPELTDWLVSCSPGWTSANEFRYQIVKMIVFYVIPVCFMGVTYTRIAICLWESTKQAGVLTESSTMASQIRTRQRTAKMLIVVVILFVLCYFPVYLFNTLRYVNILEKLPKEIIPPIALAAHWLCHLNSAINPIIYCFMSGKFRKSFRACCECCLSKWNSQNEPGFSTRMADGYSKATSVTSTKFTSYRAKRISSTAI